MASRPRPWKRRPRMSAFNGFVLAGALVNAAVVLILLAYWVAQG